MDTVNALGNGLPLTLAGKMMVKLKTWVWDRE